MQRSTRFVSRLRRQLSILLAASFGIAPAAFAQGGAGVITGSVINSATGSFLEGAEITLSPGNASALT